MLQAPIGITRFDTDTFSPADRHEAWANRDWPAIGMLFRSTPVRPFHNRTARFALGALTIHQGTMGAQRYERTVRDARADDLDQLLIPITLTGQQNGDAAGRAMQARPGDFALIDLAQPEQHFSSNSETIMLSVPRHLIEQDKVRVRDLHGSVVAGSVASLFRQHLVEVCRIVPNLTVGQGRMLQDTTLDVLRVTLSMAGLVDNVPTEARDVALAMAARNLIEEALASPDLTVDWLSRRLGMSRSALYRLFQEQGGVLAYIRQRRLLRVRHALTDPRWSERVGNLAIAWGFSDASHLSRSFRQEFGMGPNEFRKQSRSDRDPADEQSA